MANHSLFVPTFWSKRNPLDLTAFLAFLKRQWNQQPVRRLSTAFAVSAILHMTLMLYVAVQPPQPRLSRGTEIEARIIFAQQINPQRDITANQIVLTAPQTSDLKVASNYSAELTSEPAISFVTSRDNVSEKIEQQAATPRVDELSRPVIPLPADHTYYPASQLDIRPKSLAPIVPVFPSDAAAAHVNGRVVLLVLIDETGQINDVSIVEATPAGYFEEATLIAIRNMRFHPGQRFGQAVKSRVLLSIDYDEPNHF
ncbi:MAG: energy transducer TonB [Pseudomonadota bacterium]